MDAQRQLRKTILVILEVLAIVKAAL